VGRHKSRRIQGPKGVTPYYPDKGTVEEQMPKRIHRWFIGGHSFNIEDRKMVFNRAIVGRIFQAIFLKKFLSRSLRLSFNKAFQKVNGSIGLHNGKWDWISVRYAELTENLPEQEDVQM
jgi:hypothetical protein